jgi:predicted amidohydrolase
MFAKHAAMRNVRLLVFPELSLSGYEPLLVSQCAMTADDARLDPLRRLASDAHMTIVAGAPVPSCDGGFHIGAFALSPDGSAFTYCKHHLHSSEESYFRPNSGESTLNIDGTVVALAICADTSHPEHAEAAALQGAGLYAAGVLFSPKGYAPDAVLMKQYASQHKMAVLMANYAAPSGGWTSAGKSAIWSSGGELLVSASGIGEALVYADLTTGVGHVDLLPIEC